MMKNSNKILKMSSSKQQLVLTSSELDMAYNDEALLKKLIDSKKLPSTIKTIEDAILVRQTGRELGLTFMQATLVLFPVNGRLALTTQGMTSLLLSMGIAVKTLVDFQPMSIPVLSGDEIKELKTYGTTIELKRRFPTGIQTEVVTFTWRDAQVAGLVTKDTYKTYPKAMIWARCLAMGARRIAADILAGIGYIVEELETVHGKQNVILDDVQIPEPIKETISKFEKISAEEAEIIEEVKNQIKENQN